jgi:hypothetical protein
MGRLVVNLNQGTKLLVYFALTLGLMVVMLCFVLYVIPLSYPIWAERLWAMWLISGLFMFPYMLLMIYVVVRITGSLWQFDRWQWEFMIVGAPLSLFYLTALGYIFSFIIPDDLELFRSGTLPAVVFTATILVFARTKYAKKHRVHPHKESTV